MNTFVEVVLGISCLGLIFCLVVIVVVKFPSQKTTTIGQVVFRLVLHLIWIAWAAFLLFCK